jgi:hypothetical protein
MYLMKNRGARLGDNKIVDKLICNNCTGAPKVELKCTGCGKVRALEHFSSAQRNAPDTARCRKCISEIENVFPGQQEHEEYGSDEEYITVSTSQRSMPKDIAHVLPDHGWQRSPLSCIQQWRRLFGS